MENIYVLTSSTIPASKLSTELKRVKQASRREIKTSKPSLNNASIALVYLDKRDSNPLNAIIQIKLKWPEMAVVYIGHKITFKLLIELMRVGLSDYLTQPVTQEDIDDSVERICLRMKVLRFDPEHYKLTTREIQVCNLLTKGLISKEIAEYLNLTPATVKVYKSRLFNKLSVKTISDLMRKVLN